MQGAAGETEGSKRRGRPRAGERRDAVVEAAYAAFLDLGFSGTTTEIVAARAHISKRTIYELFADKAELFAAVVEKRRHLILDLPRPAGEDLPPLDALVKIFRLDMDRQHDREREALLHLVFRELALLPALSDLLYGRGIIRSREDLMEWLERTSTRGAIHVQDPALCAGLMMDVVFGALLPRRREAGDEARERRKADIKARLTIVLDGLGRAPPGSLARSGDGGKLDRVAAS